MSNQATPVLFLNLAGEMLYVLDQRLRTQNIAMQKGQKVMGDIVSNVFNASLLGEIFKHQTIYGKKNLGSIFQRLVNSSIMRVDPASMEKLYDLMLMTFKYQLVKSANLMDMVHITLNHLDSTLAFVSKHPDAEKMTEDGFKWFVKYISDMSIGELILIKQTLFSFMHDLRSKVSVLISIGEQNQDGSFIIRKDVEVPSGFDIPGTIRYCEDGRIEKFDTGARYHSRNVQTGSMELKGKRITQLGLNLYGAEGAKGTFKAEYQPSPQNFIDAESKLLGHLIGASLPRPDAFSLNLFGPDPLDISENTTSTKTLSDEETSRRLNIRAETVKNKALSDIKNDFSDIGPSCSQDDDLLAMMDNA